MKCTDVQDLLIETDDLSTLEGRKEFVEHLASCPNCQASYRQEQSLKSVFRKLGEAPPPYDLEKRVLAIFQLPAKPLPSTSWFGIPLRFGLSFALVALLAVGLLQWQQPSDRGKIVKEPASSQQMVLAPTPSPAADSLGSRAKEEREGLREKLTAGLDDDSKKAEVEIPASSAPSEPRKVFELASRLPDPKDLEGERPAPAMAPAGVSQKGGRHAAGGLESNDATKSSTTPAAKPMVVAPAAPAAQPIVMARTSPAPVPASDKAPPPPPVYAAAPKAAVSTQEKGKVEAKVMGNKAAAPLNSLDGAQMARADVPNAGANAFSEEKTPQTAPEGEVLLMVDSQKMKEDRDSAGFVQSGSQDREKKRALPQLAKTPSPANVRGESFESPSSSSALDESFGNRPSRSKDLKMSAVQESPQGSGIAPEKNVPATDGQNPLRGRAKMVDPKSSMDGTLLEGVSLKTAQDRIESILRQHRSEIADGPISLDEWLRKGWISASGIANLRPPPGKAWFVKRQASGWSVTLR